MYFKTMNTRFEAIEKKLDAKCDSKEIIRQEIDALHICKPNDVESRNLLTTKNSGILVEETVREINERKIGKTFSYIQCPRTKNKPKGREGEDRYGVC